MPFTKAAELSQLTENVPFRTDVDGVPVALVRIGEDVYAVHDTCSHAEFSLAEGMVWDCQIECALHGSMFDLRSGEPESLPATDPVPTFAVQLDGDAVLVDAGESTNGAPYPEH